MVSATSKRAQIGCIWQQNASHIETAIQVLNLYSPFHNALAYESILIMINWPKITRQNFQANLYPDKL